jgi:hypothetical protein
MAGLSLMARRRNKANVGVASMWRLTEGVWLLLYNILRMLYRPETSGSWRANQYGVINVA